MLMIQAEFKVDGHRSAGSPPLEQGAISPRTAETPSLRINAGAPTLTRIHYLGVGHISGGEEGVLGPSISARRRGERLSGRPPHSPEAIAAKAMVVPAALYIGLDGVGAHYVKMVHNGIEYADTAFNGSFTVCEICGEFFQL